MAWGVLAVSRCGSCFFQALATSGSWEREAVEAEPDSSGVLQLDLALLELACLAFLLLLLSLFQGKAFGNLRE